MRYRTAIALTALAFTSASGLAVAAPASAATPVYRNCVSLNRVYPNGVARSGARDNTPRGVRRVIKFVVNNRAYAANRRLDGDHDGIACERYLPDPKPIVRHPAPIVTVPPRVVPTRPTTVPPKVVVPAAVPWAFADHASPTTLTVNWGLANNATRYELGWIEQPGGRTWLGQRPDYADYTNGPVVLTGLLPGHRYTITIHSYNVNVPGPVRVIYNVGTTNVGR